MHKNKHRESYGLKQKHRCVILIIVKHIHKLCVQLLWVCYTSASGHDHLISHTCRTDYNILSFQFLQTTYKIIVEILSNAYLTAIYHYCHKIQGFIK